MTGHRWASRTHTYHNPLPHFSPIGCRCRHGRRGCRLTALRLTVGRVLTPVGMMVAAKHRSSQGRARSQQPVDA